MKIHQKLQAATLSSWRAHLEDFSIPHQFFNWVFRVKSISAKDLVTKGIRKNVSVEAEPWKRKETTRGFCSADFSTDKRLATHLHSISRTLVGDISSQTFSYRGEISVAATLKIHKHVRAQWIFTHFRAESCHPCVSNTDR